MKRFLVLWFVLASTWLAARMVSSFMVTTTSGVDRILWTQLAIVPALQAAVLQFLARRFRR